jgi:hypothetical protein
MAIQHTVQTKLSNLTSFTHLYVVLSESTGLGKKKKKIHGLSPRANYTARETAACRRSDCQLLRIKGATWSA